MTWWMLCCALATAVLAGGIASRAIAKTVQLDPGFGSGGRALKPVDLGASRIYSEVNVQMARSPSGEIFTAGGLAGETVVVGFLGNGHIDRGFAHDGLLRIASVEDQRFELGSLAVDPMGRIVVAGTVNSTAEILRFTPTGEPDPTFGGGDGVITTDFGLPHVASEEHTIVGVLSIAVDQEGRILVGGFYDKEFGVREPDITRGFLGRLTPGGTVDAAFGSSGTIIDEEPGTAQSLSFDSSGRLLFIGSGIQRLEADGKPDQSFGQGGRVSTPIPLQVVSDSSGRVLVLTSSDSVLRLLEDGAVDASFGNQGTATFLLPGEKSGIEDIAPGSDGSVFLTGAEDRERPFEHEPRRRLVFTRMSADGQLDRQFGKRGIVRTLYGHGSNTVGKQVLPIGHGRVLVAGMVKNPRLPDGEGLALFRYRVG